MNYSKLKNTLLITVLFLAVNMSSLFAQGVIDATPCKIYQGTWVIDISLITDCKVNLIVKSESNQVLINDNIDTHNRAILLPRGKYYIQATEIGCAERTQTIEIELK